MYIGKYYIEIQIAKTNFNEDIETYQVAID